MNIVNLYSQYRDIYLFLRDFKGTLEIKKVKDFFPYFYEKSESGQYHSYKGEPLRKMFVSMPRDIVKQRSNSAFEADILFAKRYLIDRVTTLEKCPIKYAFIDVEIQSDELPNVQLAEKPVSCITIYNSFSKEYKTFYRGDYESEYKMLQSFMDYMKEEKFDIWLSWHVAFDYNYLYNRIPDFAQKISPIGKNRYGDGEILYPAGTSIIDYLAWFKKVTLNKEKQYTLDYIAEKHLGKGKEYSKVDFNKVSEEIKNRNIEDVEIMVKLEEKFKLIGYYDEVRRLAKVEWEDLIWNSRTIDMLLLQEAKKQNVVLPMKPKENEKEDFLGAFREAFETGAFTDGIGKYDLSSAYPFAIINFCLDPANIRRFDNKGVIADGAEVISIHNTHFAQNENALLPTVVKKMIILKNNIKAELKKLPLESPEYTDTKTKYNAIKSIVNSCYGVMGNRFFRLYDKEVASATTFLVRDLLHYVKDSLDAKGYVVVYVDTDSVFIKSREDLTEFLNGLIQKWAKEKYDKAHVDIDFEYEGIYEKLLILTKCRYIGYLKTDKGMKEEIKGVEAKRKDSTVFMKKFQRTLIDKILDKEPKKEIISWIKTQVKEVKNAPISEIAFPCKLARQPDEYANVPIFLRALQSTPGFSKKVGNSFYYIYMKPFGHEEITKEVLFLEGKKLTPSMLKKAWKSFYGEDVLVKGMDAEKKDKLIQELVKSGKIKMKKIKVKGKVKNVMAFDDEEFKHINRAEVDWETMTNRNIYMKLSTIFEAMQWSLTDVV